jgi:amino acid transporter
MNTGARVTYAMGVDEEVPEHFGLLHSENLTPHRAIWTLAAISAVVGVISVSLAFGDAGAPQDAAIKALPQGLFSSVGYSTHDGMAALPNTLLTMTLASNFGTFLLYALSCVICMIAYHGRSDASVLKHVLIPAFGLIANLGCMLFYLIGPFMGFGTVKEPLLALGIALVWGIYGGIYFVRSSKAKGRTTLVSEREMGTAS